MGKVVVRVSALSKPQKVAGATIALVRQNNVVELQTIGAGSLNQAVKALAIARCFAEKSNQDLIFRPAFEDKTIGGQTMTAIRLMVEMVPIK